MRFLLLFIIYTLSYSAYSGINKLDSEMKNSKSQTMIEKCNWLGKSFLEAQDKLGAFKNEETFNMKDVIITEFRGNLEVLFPRTITENGLIKIKEVSWEQEDFFLTLWFEKRKNTWMVIDALYWNKEAEF